MQSLATNESMALDNGYIPNGQPQGCEMDNVVPGEDNDDGSDIDMEFEATISGDDTDPDDKTYVACIYT